MKTTLGIEFEPFFPQISHRAKIGCAKYDLSTGEGVAMEQWYLNMGEVPGTPLSQIVGIVVCFSVHMIEGTMGIPRR